NFAMSIADMLERDVNLQLPPSRTVVDWSATKADKIATWFLDNIPGNISLVTAPVGAFGEGTAQRNSGFSSDSESECSCSSCSCSFSSSDSEGSTSSESDYGNNPGTGDMGMKRPSTQISLDASVPLAVPMDLPAVAPVSHVGVNLPKPVGMSAIHKERQNEDTTCSSNGGAGQQGPETDIPGSPHKSTPEPKAGEDVELARSGEEEEQAFLILSKPGGRFVPIDMVRGRLLSTVEPPPVPRPSDTGGNVTHMMNIDTSDSLRGLQMSAAADLYVQQYAGVDISTLSSSYFGRSSSWHSNSIVWPTNIPIASYNSTGNPIDRSIAHASGDGPVPKSQRSHPSLADKTTPIPAHPAGDDSSVPPTPSDTGSFVSVNIAHRVPHDVGSAGSMLSGQPGSRRSQVSGGAQSYFNSVQSMSGGAPSASGIRPARGMYRGSNDGYRNSSGGSVGLNSLYLRGAATSGSATPVGTNAYSRMVTLGAAGLRGYIGNQTNRQRNSGSSSVHYRGDDSSLSSGMHTLNSAYTASRGYSMGFGSNTASGVVLRDNLPIVPSTPSNMPAGQSLVTGTDRSAKHRLEVARQGAKGRRGSSSIPAVASASPQKGQHISRYSPSFAGWSASYKESSILSTIRDQDDTDEAERGCAPEHDTSKSDVGVRGTVAATSSSGRKVPPGALPSDPLSTPVKDPYTSPFGDESGRSYWQHTEPQSVRSHSSLGTGTSAHQLAMGEEKEEEVEDAPQPMEADVATFMVGGVSTGKRKRAILSSITGDKMPADPETDDVDEQESNQL
ncbi:hypothetical protein EC988_005159, partial [Linderina pennispora]